ncbi:hypothetical protein HQ590_16440, partial [bacterium]|nr:hypothetical protein [bacterium]
GFDAGTPGWGVDHFATIQEGIDAAAAGGTVDVAAGTYAESVTLTKNNLALVGDPGARPVITGGLRLSTGMTGLILRNLSVKGNAVPSQNSVVRMDGVTTDLTVDNCLFDGESVAGRHGFTGGTMEGNVTVLGSEFKDIDGWAVFDTRSGSGGDGSALGTVTFASNHVHNCNGTVVFRGLSTDFTENVYIFRNTFEDIGTPTSDHWAAFEVNRANHVEIYQNVIRNVSICSWGEGQAMQLWKVGTVVIRNNDIRDNWEGIAFLKWPVAETYDLAGMVVYGNLFSNNTDFALSVADGLTGGPLNATSNWWGAADGPGPVGPGSGDEVSLNVDYSPWLGNVPGSIPQLYVTPTGTIVDGSGTFLTDRLIAAHQSFVVHGAATLGNLSTPVTWTVDDGTLEVDGMTLTDGSTLVVRNGTLILHTAAGVTTLAGSFIVFDSWGTILFEDDTTISGDTLALVSHLVFKDGVTLTVTGSLVLDGCRLEADTVGDHYYVQADPGSTFKMYRTELLDCGTDSVLPEKQGLYINTDAAEIESSLFIANNVGVVVGASATDCRVYHNIYTNNAVNVVDSGAGTVGVVDGWGSVYQSGAVPAFDTAPQTTTRNDLGLYPDGADSLNDRYITTGATVLVEMAIDRLSIPVSGCDALLGYDSYYFTADSALVPYGGANDWSELIYSVSTQQVIGAVTYGQINSSIGLGLVAPQEGSTNDAIIATVGLTATTNEGVTKIFFRAPVTNDIPFGTRLASNTNGESGVYLMPFTANTGYLTIDGTAPAVQDLAGWQTQGTNVVLVTPTPSGAVAHQGVIVFEVDAFDALAGLDPAGPQLVLTNVAAGTALGWTLTGSTNVDIGGVTYTRYQFEGTVLPTSANGVYDATVTVMDRSSNVTTLETSFEVEQLQLTVTVTLVGAWTGTFDRSVMFAATDGAGTVLKRWTNTVTFASRTGTAELFEVPAGMAKLSAKTDWTLRQRVTPVTDGDGEVTASLTLQGGDLNGDNQVTTLDYTRLRFYWYTTAPQADITGDGQTSTPDYTILKVNWYQAGDPE